MTDEHSQDIDLQETDDGMKFDRGSALSIFEKDRNEDYIALINRASDRTGRLCNRSLTHCT